MTDTNATLLNSITGADEARVRVLSEDILRSTGKAVFTVRFADGRESTVPPAQVRLDRPGRRYDAD